MKKPMTKEIRDIQFTISTPGFGVLDAALKTEEASLIRSLRKCPTEKIEYYRGQLFAVEKIKRFLGLKLLSLEQALEMGEDFDKKIMAQNIL